MQYTENNYAFIDSQNVNLEIRKLGWNLDFKKFRIYLREKYDVSVAYLFIGYIKTNERLYSFLTKAGYVLIFKPVMKDWNGTIKGNVDADLVLRAMIEFNNYDKALLVSSDGDFYSLVKYLYEKNKLKIVISPNIKKCSIFLKQAAMEKIVSMDDLQQKLNYQAEKDR